MRHLVFVDPEGRFIDDRIKQFPIHLVVDPYQVQPIFQLNKLIKNETIKIGINNDLKFYRTLKLELNDYENLDSNHTLGFNIEKFKINYFTLSLNLNFIINLILKFLIQYILILIIQ